MTVDEQERLAQRFEEQRIRLRAMAYRMLGSLNEADDVVQEAWLRLSRVGADDIQNLGGWLTTVVANLCLTTLRSRRSRREEPVGVRLPDPIVTREDGSDPEQQALLADAVGLALLVLLDTLGPAERVAFVLHDMFAVPFDEIAVIVGRAPAAARQLASRARRRVRTAAPVPDVDLAHQRNVVDVFLAAARDGDLEALIAVLDPDVVLRVDGGVARAPLSMEVRGASRVTQLALVFASLGLAVRPVQVNGAAGALTAADGQHHSVMGFTVRGGTITTIDILADPERLRGLDPALLNA